MRAEYATEHPDEARALANLRSGLARATNAHAQAVRAAASGQTPDELRYWGDRAAQLRLVLTAAVFGAARAEHVYSTWLASKTELTVTQHDVRLEIDRVPTHAQVTHWAAGSSGSLPSDWVATVETLQTAICIDLEGPGDLSVGTGLRFEPQASDDVVHFRPPRAAVLRVFKVVPSSTQPGRHTLDPVEVRHLAVACPGNETRISVQTSSRATNAVAVTFDDTGALTKVTTDLKDPVAQRSTEVKSLVDVVTESVTSGKDLRDALAPPSLVDRAAEAKAAAELGLVPTQDDPLKELKAQLEENELRARLRVAEQLQASRSVPVFVSLTSTT